MSDVNLAKHLNGVRIMLFWSWPRGLMRKHGNHPTVTCWKDEPTGLWLMTTRSNYSDARTYPAIGTEQGSPFGSLPKHGPGINLDQFGFVQSLALDRVRCSRLSGGSLGAWSEYDAIEQDALPDDVYERLWLFKPGSGEGVIAAMKDAVMTAVYVRQWERELRSGFITPQQDCQGVMEGLAE